MRHLFIASLAALVLPLASAATLDANSEACEVYNSFRAAMCKCAQKCIPNLMATSRFFLGVGEIWQIRRNFTNHNNFQWNRCAADCVKDELGLRGQGFRVNNEVARTCMAGYHASDALKEDRPVWHRNMWTYKIKDCAYEKCSGKNYGTPGLTPCAARDL